jgi:hypothetical protein
MNGPATFRDQYALSHGIVAPHSPIFRREKTMTSAVAAFAIAVGATSLICYLLMTRLPSRRANRASPGKGFGADGVDFGGSGGWSLSHGFSGDHSALDASGNPIDFGGGDAGGGDSGGGGDGGGDGGGGGD